MLNITAVYTVCVSSGYPNEPAADIALGTVKKWIEENSDKVQHIAGLKVNSSLEEAIALFLFHFP